MGLYVGKVGTKKALRAQRQSFRLINEFTAAVIALPDIFRIIVSIIPSFQHAGLQ